MTDPRTALEVWGDPIDHSLSPVLHAAAYAQLGWEWTYGRRRVSETSFADELVGLDATYRGLSITFPLKGVAYQAAVRRDRAAQLTGAVNTLLMGPDGPAGWNTDVGGIVADLQEQGVAGLENARIVGAGATATSAVVALEHLGARRIEVVARRPEAVVPLQVLGERIGVVVTASPFDGVHSAVPVTIAALPGGTTFDPDVADRVAHEGGMLYDVVYGAWPTALAQAWQRVGREAIAGRGMLLHQAVRQIRVFATGDVEVPLPDEPAVVADMRRALMGD